MKKTLIFLTIIVFGIISLKAQTHDLGINEILPETIHYADSAKIFPAIKIHNFGTQDETNFDVEVIINDGSQDVYNCTETVSEIISAGSDMYVTMGMVWTITDPEPDYTIDATVILVGDENNGNDSDTEVPTITQLTYSKQTYAMRYVYGSSDDPLISIDLQTGDPEIILDNIDYYAKTGAEFVYGVLYGLDNTTNQDPYMFILQEDGVEIPLGIVTGTEHTPTGITYDANNNIMYVVAVSNNYESEEDEGIIKGSKDNDCYLYTLNMQTYKLTEIGLINNGQTAKFFDIEYANGKIYAIDIPDNTRIWEIDPVTAIGTPKPQWLTMAYSNYDHCLSYDPVTEIMYATLFHWASGSDYRGYFCEVNLENGSATVIKEYGIEHNVKFLAIQPTAIKDITSFQIPDQVGETEINNELHTVTVYMPFGTNVTNLIPEIEVSDDVTEIDPPSGVPQDFTGPVEYTLTGKFGYGQIWTVTVDILTGIISANSGGFNIYPNPSNGVINLDLPEGPTTVEITDVTGTVIFTADYAPSKIDLSNQPKGIYFIKIKTETGIYTEKLVIQ